MKKVALGLSAVLIVIEGIVSMLPFVLSWWACAIWRAIKLGHTVSGLEADAKRSLVRSLFGDEP